MTGCDLCREPFPKHLTVIGELAFCDTCYTKVKKLVSNYVRLTHATRDPNTVKYSAAKAALEDSLRRKS